MRILMITPEWPTDQNPFAVPFQVQQVRFLRESGVEVDVFYFRGAKNPINYLKALLRLRRHRPYAERAYDLVHAQFGQAALLPWPKRLPLVITFHGVDMLGQLSAAGRMTLQGKLLVWLGRMAARFADAVIIVSDEMRKNLPASKPLHILPTGVDLAALPALTTQEARRELGLDSAERLVLFVGNPRDPLKRFARAREAVDVLNEKMAARLILGWDMPHQEIIKLMRACDVLVVTSLQEGSPTIVKEALACDLAVVSVVVGDVVERLRGVDGCEVVPDDRPGTIAAALERSLARTTRVRGRDAVMMLDERVLADRLIKIYRSVVERNPSRTEGSRSSRSGDTSDANAGVRVQ
jgi:teichuronic acid biosynthesis glycosyltransferase TuaC